MADQQTTGLAVRQSVVVEAPQERAFAVFTQQVDTWWPIAERHIGGSQPVAAVLEGHVGGRWFERAADGTECPWGRVLAWEPPTRVVLSWEVSADWQPDPGTSSTVEVRFESLGERRTRVELEHRGLEVYGERAQEMRDMFDGPDAWADLLARFRETAAGASGAGASGAGAS